MPSLELSLEPPLRHLTRTETGGWLPQQQPLSNPL